MVALHTDERAQPPSRCIGVEARAPEPWAGLLQVRDTSVLNRTKRNPKQSARKLPTRGLRHLSQPGNVLPLTLTVLGVVRQARRSVGLFSGARGFSPGRGVQCCVAPCERWPHQQTNTNMAVVTLRFLFCREFGGEERRGILMRFWTRAVDVLHRRVLNATPLS